MPLRLRQRCDHNLIPDAMPRVRIRSAFVVASDSMAATAGAWRRLAGVYGASSVGMAAYGAHGIKYDDPQASTPRLKPCNQ